MVFGRRLGTILAPDPKRHTQTSSQRTPASKLVDSEGKGLAPATSLLVIGRSTSEPGAQVCGTAKRLLLDYFLLVEIHHDHFAPVGINDLPCGIAGVEGELPRLPGDLYGVKVVTGDDHTPLRDIRHISLGDIKRDDFSQSLKGARVAERFTPSQPQLLRDLTA
jgi:hypothetical protein